VCGRACLDWPVPAPKPNLAPSLLNQLMAAAVKAKRKINGESPCIFFAMARCAACCLLLCLKTAAFAPPLVYSAAVQRAAQHRLCNAVGHVRFNTAVYSSGAAPADDAADSGDDFDDADADDDAVTAQMEAEFEALVQQRMQEARAYVGTSPTAEEQEDPDLAVMMQTSRARLHQTAEQPDNGEQQESSAVVGVPLDDRSGLYEQDVQALQAHLFPESSNKHVAGISAAAALSREGIS
jgi:hypothetical protein